MEQKEDEAMDIDELSEYFVMNDRPPKRLFFLEHKSPKLGVDMRPSTLSAIKATSSKSRLSGGSSAQNIIEEPYVNNNLPDPNLEPAITDSRFLEDSLEECRRRSEESERMYNKTKDAIIAQNRQTTAILYQRFTEDEEKKRMDAVKSKEAFQATVPSSKSATERKRRNAEWDEDTMKRNQPNSWQQQQMLEHQRQAMQHQQQQHYMMMQQQQQQQRLQQQHQQQQAFAAQNAALQCTQIPSTSSMDTNALTPASLHQPSPMNPTIPNGVHSHNNSFPTPPDSGLSKDCVSDKVEQDMLKDLKPDQALQDLGDLDLDAYIGTLDANPSMKEKENTTNPNRVPVNQPMMTAAQLHHQQQLHLQQQQQHQLQQQQQHQFMLQQQQQQHHQEMMKQQHMFGANGGSVPPMGTPQHAHYIHQMRQYRLQQQQLQQQHHPQNGMMDPRMDPRMMGGYGMQAPGAAFPPTVHPHAQHMYGQPMPFANMN